MHDLVYSFVMLTYNSDKYIYKSLSSLYKFSSEINEKIEIYIIDNGSIDNTNEIIKNIQTPDNTKLIHLQLGKNTGTTFSRNIGLRSCNGEFIIVLDSDAYINKSSIIELRDYLLKNKSCGIVVPKIVFPNGKYQLSTDVFPTILRKLQRYFFLRNIEKTSAITELTKVDYAISAFWMFKKDLIRNIGYLDEKIFYSPEDVDYCIRVWKHGLTIDYYPNCSIIHDAQEISRKNKDKRILNRFLFSHIKGLLYLYIKHRFIFSSRKLRR